MARVSTQPHSATTNSIRTIAGAVANLHLKGKQEKLTKLLLAAASGTASPVLESQVLLDLYGGNGVDQSNKSSLRDLVSRVNKRLKLLPVDGLKVSCETLIEGGSRYLFLRIGGEPVAQAVPQAPNKIPGSNDSKKPRFRWKGPGASPRLLDVWVPVHGPDTEFTFRLESVAWVPPAGFSGYAKHREACWKRYQEKHPNCPNTRVWHVSEFTQRSNRHGKANHAIEFTIAPVFFSDVVATTWELKTAVSGDHGETTIADWLASGAPKDSACRHFLPAANPLMVEVNVITRDGKLIVREYRDRKTGVNRWEPAVFGFVDSLQDVYRNAVHLPDPSETVFRKSCQLLGLAIHPARICWLGVGFGLTEGKVGLFGEVEVELSAEEILALGRGVRRLKEVDVVPGVIHEFCRTEKLRRHFEALLALSLKHRNPRVNIVTSVPKATHG